MKKSAGIRRAVRYHKGMDETATFVANVNALVDAGEISISEIARRANINRAEFSPASRIGRVDEAKK